MTKDRTLWIGGAVATILVHLAFWRGYGWFRDEFYYVACAAHLDYGYVDQPALSILPLAVVRAIAGDSLFAIRLIVALVCGAMVFVVGGIAASLGGGRFAQLLAMLCAVIAPVYLALGSFYSMNAFDLLAWAIVGWIAIELLKEPRPRLWVALGVAVGLGFENKISMLWLAGGLGVGLLLTPERRLLLSRGPWIAAVIAAALFTPYLIWQLRHSWFTLEFIRSASANKMATHSPLAFFLGQVQDLHPLSAPVWISGLYFYLVSPEGRRFRTLGIAYVAVFLLLIFDATSRSGYLAAAYTIVIPAGGVQVERLLSGRWQKARAPVFATLAIAGALVAPMGMPVLPVGTYLSYSAALGQKPSTEEKKEVGELSQFYADRFGWDEIVRGIADAYATLSPEERRVAVVFASNYGEAGAVDVLGRAYHLPFATSGHNNYWLWGPPPPGTGSVAIVFAPVTREQLQARFAQVDEAGTIDCGYCMPYENHRPVFVARHPKGPSYQERWSLLRHFD